MRQTISGPFFFLLHRATVLFCLNSSPLHFCSGLACTEDAAAVVQSRARCFEAAAKTKTIFLCLITGQYCAVRHPEGDFEPAQNAFHGKHFCEDVVHPASPVTGGVFHVSEASAACSQPA